MSFCQACRQTNVAFVFQDQDRPRFSDAEIDTADPDLGFGKSLTKDPACGPRQDIDAVRFFDSELFNE
ncbi:MAG: hypothetical protein DMF62_07960 [Acidobacteria bacterium]|nr:MAG: hypothetical protein DMF62_07960 [Acidobacteriota bacterium]